MQVRIESNGQGGVCWCIPGDRRYAILSNNPRIRKELRAMVKGESVGAFRVTIAMQFLVIGLDLGRFELRYVLVQNLDKFV